MCHNANANKVTTAMSCCCSILGVAPPDVVRSQMGSHLLELWLLAALQDVEDLCHVVVQVLALVLTHVFLEVGSQVAQADLAALGSCFLRAMLCVWRLGFRGQCCA